mgnify:CR=1 FL=1
MAKSFSSSEALSRAKATAEYFQEFLSFAIECGSSTYAKLRGNYFGYSLNFGYNSVTNL